MTSVGFIGAARIAASLVRALSGVAVAENQEVLDRSDAIFLCPRAATMLPALRALLGGGAGWLGERTGDPRAAEGYVATLAAGYPGQMPRDSAGRFAGALAEMATPGGIGAQMVSRLDAASVPSHLHGALDAVGARLDGR